MGSAIAAVLVALVAAWGPDRLPPKTRRLAVSAHRGDREGHERHPWACPGSVGRLREPCLQPRSPHRAPRGHISTAASEHLEVAAEWASALARGGLPGVLLLLSLPLSPTSPVR